MAGKPYPVQRYAHPPPPVNTQYNQSPYNPSPYPPQQSAAYPPAAQYLVQNPMSAAYPPQASAPPTGPPPPYYPSDPYPNQMAAYPPVTAGYPLQHSSYPPLQHAAYPPGVHITGEYDSSARFGAGATHNIPPPPPGVIPNAAQIASMRGSSVQMTQRPAGWFEGHNSGGSTFW